LKEGPFIMLTVAYPGRQISHRIYYESGQTAPQLNDKFLHLLMSDIPGVDQVKEQLRLHGIHVNMAYTNAINQRNFHSKLTQLCRRFDYGLDAPAAAQKEQL